MSCSNDSMVLKNTNLGVFYVAHGSIYVAPYIVCIAAMLTKELREITAYKIMAIMGAVDMMQLLFSCYVAGTLSIIGSHSCLDHVEWWNKMLSSMAWASWCVYSTLSILLAYDRIPQDHQTTSFLRLGNNMWIIVSMCFMYGVIQGLLHATPWAGYWYEAHMGQYVINKRLFLTFWILVFHNTGIAISITVIYFVIIRKYRHRFASIRNRRRSSDKAIRSLLFTSLVICTLTSFAAIAYIIAPLVAPYWSFFPPIMTVGHVAWQTISGGNCFVYLTMNKTLRNEVKKLLHLIPSENLDVKPEDDHGTSCHLASEEEWTNV